MKKIFLIAISFLLGDCLFAQSVKFLDDYEIVQSENDTWTSGASPVKIGGANKFPERLRKIYTKTFNNEFKMYLEEICFVHSCPGVTY